MIYKVIYEKFLINDKFSIGKSNALFSTKLILSSEIAMNLFAAYYFLNKYFNINFDLVTLILTAMSIPLFIVFGLVKNTRILELDNKGRKSNNLHLAIAVTYSIISFICFIMVLERLDF